MMTLRSLGGLWVVPAWILGMAVLVVAETPKAVPMAEGTYRVKVESLRVDERGYSVTLKGTDSKANVSTRTSTSNRADESILKFLRHLKEGEEYDFPKVFEEVFGKDYARMHGAVVREFGFTPGDSAFPSLFGKTPPAPRAQPRVAVPTTLFELGTVPKFKAVVVEKTLESVLVTVTLETNYGEKLELRHAPGTTTADAKRFELARFMVSQMEKGKEYEFPDVVEHPERITAPVNSEIKPSEEMKALEAFVGKWSATRDGEAGFTGTVVLSWSSDGTSLWRDSSLQGAAKYPQGNRWFYDAAAKCYVDEVCNPKIMPPRIHMEWDVASKTLTFSEEFDVGSGKTVLKGSRTFETADRIRWKTTSIGPDGVPHDMAGYYNRVKE